MTTDDTSEQSCIELALEKKADKIIKYILDQPIKVEDIQYIKKFIENDPSRSKNTQLWQEIFLYKCIKGHHQEGFQLLCCANIVNCERKFIPCSFLEVAAEYGSFVFVEEILKKTIFERETWERAKKMALIKDHHKIKTLISDRESLLECKRRGNLSILHTAVSDNDPDMVNYILENKSLVDPNQNNETVGTALALAIVLCNEKCIEVFERFNVDCNTQNKYQQSPLHEAISNGMIDKCRYLIDRSQNIDEEGFMEQTALHCAVICGCEELCEQLVKRGADCNRYMNFLRNSPQKKDSVSFSKRENCLTLCSKINKTIYSCFLETLDINKANSYDSDENFLLHLNVGSLKKDICERIITCGGNVNSVNNHGSTPLFDLLSNLDKETFNKNEDTIIDIVKLFINANYNVNKCFSGNLTIFHIISKFNCKRLVLALVPPTQQSQTLLIKEDLLRKGFEEEHFQFCEAILESFPNKYLEEYITRDFIDNALLHDQKNLLKCLVIHSNADIKQSVLEHVLYYFAKCNDQDSFDCLLNIEIKSPKYLENGETLLTKLLIENKLIFCEKLIQSEMNDKKYVNLKNERNQTPLQVAIEVESMEILQMLTFETDYLDNEDNKGRTALMQLFEKLSNNIDRSRYFALMIAIRVIIYEGGNIYYETSKGEKVIDLCRRSETKMEIEKSVKANRRDWTVEKEKVMKVKEIAEGEKVTERKDCDLCADRKMDSTFECGHKFCKNCRKSLE